MKNKGLLGKDKEPKVKAEVTTNTEPVVKAEWKKAKPVVNAKAETKWKPKPAGKGTKSKKRF